jgi:four helix bundle protein
MNEKETRPLPHHRLIAFGVAKELLLAVQGAKISDAELRDQALRAAKGAALNVAEAAGRASDKDKARVFMIARGEAVEAAAAVEIAQLVGAASAEAVSNVNQLANRLVALLTGLARR